MRKYFAVLLILAVMEAAPIAAATLPAGTELEIRLQTKIASDASKVKDPVEAVVISPVSVDSQVIIPPGTKLHGVVVAVQSTEGKTDQRARLKLQFNELEDAAGHKTKISIQLTGIDNARETVDDQGQINGILASETISAQLDAQIKKVGGKNSGLAGWFENIKNAALKAPQPEIGFDPGVDMAAKLTDKLNLQPLKSAQAGGTIPAYSAEELSILVNAQPFQTKAAKIDKPSDVTNLMLVGNKEQIEAAFAAAGWTAAAALNQQTGLETFRAIAENRGYKESPVSLLILDGRGPDLVFQKQNNTFAKRHHLRIWQRPGQFLDKPIWVVSATHDTGIAFSPENRTFIHKIDSNIDAERAKVANDLQFTGKVKILTLVDRPAVPKDGSNATGDKLLTDGKMMVLWFQ